ncbi:hypothetical protein JCGZ_03815 [Jatropha curcas]|uniref:Uncharacterized protein n=1 Tax=Jatropha curcas TaxID=180498 RepID=A0A067KXX5_JATCU|nr:hypothetical protein JCGZ_03815 [Jatropha curcas]
MRFSRPVSKCRIGTRIRVGLRPPRSVVSRGDQNPVFETRTIGGNRNRNRPNLFSFGSTSFGTVNQQFQLQSEPTVLVPSETGTETGGSGTVATPSMEIQTLARSDRAIWHARATDSSLDVSRSTARAEPPLELRLWHALPVQNSTPVLRIRYCFESRTPASCYNLHGPTSDMFLTYKSRSSPIYGDERVLIDKKSKA